MKITHLVFLGVAGFLGLASAQALAQIAVYEGAGSFDNSYAPAAVHYATNNFIILNPATGEQILVDYFTYQGTKEFGIQDFAMTPITGLKEGAKKVDSYFYSAPGSGSNSFVTSMGTEAKKPTGTAGKFTVPASLTFINQNLSQFSGNYLSVEKAKAAFNGKWTTKVNQHGDTLSQALTEIKNYLIGLNFHQGI